MTWSLPIGTLRGTVVRVHVTFVVFLVWIGVAHYLRGGPRAAAEGVAFMVLLFLSVLLHEFGHIFMARHFGVRTPDVTLLPIGGIARLERIPDAPKQEIAIALAGPAVNLVIAALLVAGLGSNRLPSPSMRSRSERGDRARPSTSAGHPLRPRYASAA